MLPSLIDSQIVNQIGIIYLQNAELNLLSTAFIRELNQALDLMAENDSVQVIIITSLKKFFCAGANLKELIANGGGVNDRAADGGGVKDRGVKDRVVKDRVVKEQGVNDCVFAETINDWSDPIEDWQHLSFVKKPVIACVMGGCLGGGLEMALMCDFIFACNEAHFGFPEIKLGLLPGGGGTLRILNRLSVARATELMMTGESISSEKALEWGLINAIFTKEKCLENTIQFAEKLASYAKESLMAIKRIALMAKTLSPEDHLKLERKIFYQRLDSIDARAIIDTFFNRKSDR